jgi:hypothetical protein
MYGGDSSGCSLASVLRYETGNEASSITGKIQAATIRCEIDKINQFYTANPRPQVAACYVPQMNYYGGGRRSGTHLAHQVRQYEICTYNQNLAVKALRQVPDPCPQNVIQAARFQQYQRRVAAAPCPINQEHINVGVPHPVNGPCNPIIGIYQTRIQ